MCWYEYMYLRVYLKHVYVLVYVRMHILHVNGF